MKEDIYYSNFRHAKLVRLLKVEVNEGDGTEADPVRRVVYFVEPETGTVIAKQGDDKDRLFAGTDEMKPLP